jgi:hypothetical protein
MKKYLYSRKEIRLNSFGDVEYDGWRKDKPYYFASKVLEILDRDLLATNTVNIKGTKNSGTTRPVKVCKHDWRLAPKYPHNSPASPMYCAKCGIFKKPKKCKHLHIHEGFGTMGVMCGQCGKVLADPCDESSTFLGVSPSKRVEPIEKLKFDLVGDISNLNEGEFGIYKLCQKQCEIIDHITALEAKL